MKNSLYYGIKIQISYQCQLKMFLKINLIFFTVSTTFKMQIFRKKLFKRFPI